MPAWTEVNWLAVIIATVASIVIGYIYYLPSVLGRTWAEAGGFELRPPNSYPVQTWVIGIVVNLVAAYALALIAGGRGLVDGAVWGAVVAIGFVSTALLGSVLFEGRSWNYWAITTAYFLISAIVMGGILGYFSAM
jgi:hypothetical protein